MAASVGRENVNVSSQDWEREKYKFVSRRNEAGEECVEQSNGSDRRANWLNGVYYQNVTYFLF